MDDTLSDLFEDARQAVIDWRGLKVYAMYEFEIPGPAATCILRFDRYHLEPPPGVFIDTPDGIMTANGLDDERMQFWPRYPSDQIEIDMRAKEAIRVQLWNVWRAEHDRIDAWIGNSGMLVERDSERRISVRCSNGGGGEVDFDDLVFTLEISQVR